jgi:hypothetical protein
MKKIIEQKKTIEFSRSQLFVNSLSFSFWTVEIELFNRIFVFLFVSILCEANQRMDWLKRLQRFDAYAKTLDDFRVKTTTGAASE